MRRLRSLAAVTFLLAHVLSVSAMPGCNNTEVRLSHTTEGYVEICDQGQWKTVCDYRWADKEAQVVCRQLSQSNPGQAVSVRRGCAGQGTGEIFEAEWHCNGSESRLLDCSHTELDSGSCDHTRDAGVYCSGVTPDNCTMINNQLRLVNGSNYASGRVEICRHGCWGTVCDDTWDRIDAIVACRQLGFITTTRNAIPTRGAYFGEGSGPIHLSQAHCQLDVSKLINCEIDKDAINDCSHSQDAGVICLGPNMSLCEDGMVQLTGGQNESEGRVEMCYNGVWGTVCANGWDERAASIVCRQLGFEESATIESYSRVGRGNTTVLFHKIDCTTDRHYSSLLDCVSRSDIRIETGSCDQDKIARVLCLSQSSETLNPSTEVTIKLGAVGGVLAFLVVAVVVAIIVISGALLIITKGRKRDVKAIKADDRGVDNPTYENRITTTPVNLSEPEYVHDFDNPIYDEGQASHVTNSTNHVQHNNEDERKFDDPVYSDVGPSSCPMPYENQVAHKGLNHGNVTQNIGDVSTDETQELANENTSGEPVVAPPEKVDSALYSELCPTYSQFQPHIPKPTQQIPPPTNDDEYSCLQH